MSQNQSIAFEIEIKKNNNSPIQPAIQKKLEELSCNAAAPPQLEDIEKKHLKAKNRRLNRHTKITNTDERVRDANERRSILVKEFTSKTQKVVEAKLETAEQLRQKALNLILEKAKKECEKVLTVHEKHNLDQTLDAKRKGDKIDSKLVTAQDLRQKVIDNVLEKAKKEQEKLKKAQESRNLVVKRKGEKIESKLEIADKLRSKILNQVVEQARKVTDKIDRAKECRQKSHQQRERTLQDNLDKVSVGSQKSLANKEMTAQKAKTHLQKVQKVAAEQKEKKVQECTTKNQIIFSKQQNAELKKQQILDEIKVKAKQSTQMKGTKSQEVLHQ